jgi:hypothetical protein
MSSGGDWFMLPISEPKSNHDLARAALTGSAGLGGVVFAVGMLRDEEPVGAAVLGAAERRVTGLAAAGAGTAYGHPER